MEINIIKFFLEYLKSKKWEWGLALTSYSEIILTRNAKTEIMIHWKTALTLLLKLFLYSVIIILINASIIFLLSWGLETFAYTLSLVMLIEGGLGLIFGSVLASYSPSAAKISEVLFHSKPWNLNRQKENEKQMRAVIVTAFMLIIEALLVSAM